MQSHLQHSNCSCFLHEILLKSDRTSCNSNICRNLPIIRSWIGLRGNSTAIEVKTGCCKKLSNKEWRGCARIQIGQTFARGLRDWVPRHARTAKSRTSIAKQRFGCAALRHPFKHRRNIGFNGPWIFPNERIDKDGICSCSAFS